MSIDKEVIDKLNAHKNTPIAPQKKDLMANSSPNDPENHKKLMQYNALLDNISIGPHTNTTIKCAGIDWTLRLMTAKEFVDINVKVEIETRDSQIFNEYFVAFNTMKRILAKALSPNPFKTEGPGIFTEEDLSHVNYDVLKYVYDEYMEFVNAATLRPITLTPEQIEALWGIVSKKPEVSMELGLMQSRTMLHYAMNYLLALEKTPDSDTNS